MPDNFVYKTINLDSSNAHIIFARDAKLLHISSKILHNYRRIEIVLY